jgi:hypothetical protein
MCNQEDMMGESAFYKIGPSYKEGEPPAVIKDTKEHKCPKEWFIIGPSYKEGEPGKIHKK